MSDKESITQIDHETVMGKIIYLSDKEDRKGRREDESISSSINMQMVIEK